jgi:hypothetical protein
MHDNARAPSAPRRDELAGVRRRALVCGTAAKADVWLVERDGVAMVVKDFAAKPLWSRVAGRVQIAREARAYAHLGDDPNVPRFIGRIDAHALAVAWVEGERLAYAATLGGDGPALYARLCRIVARFHARGLAHLDLGGNDNVLLGTDGEIYVLDLAAAVWLAPGSSSSRMFFPLLARADRAALLKWKRLLAAGEYTVEETAFLRRQRRWRALWPFNRKRKRA